MKIHKIKIEKFKSIYDPLEIDFQQVKGFWQISGPVGSGKTTIGEAIKNKYPFRNPLILENLKNVKRFSYRIHHILYVSRLLI